MSAECKGGESGRMRRGRLTEASRYREVDIAASAL